MAIGLMCFYSICLNCPPFACTDARRRFCHPSITSWIMFWWQCSCRLAMHKIVQNLP